MNQRVIPKIQDKIQNSPVYAVACHPSTDSIISPCEGYLGEKIGTNTEVIKETSSNLFVLLF